jgi:hypothetical protein
VVQDVHEIQVDLESENHSERSNLEDEPAEYHSDSSPGLDETAEDLNANPEDEGRVTQGESDINVTRDSADKGLSASSEESECDVAFRKVAGIRGRVKASTCVL